MYLETALTDVMLERTVNARHNNIYSDEIMGMVDAVLDRANNVNTDFVEAVVRTIKNKTLEW